VVLGRVGAPHGVRGWVKVFSYTDPPEAIASYGELSLVRSGGEPRRARVLESKRAGQAIAVRLEGVETREAAQALTNAEIRVERGALPPTAPGEVYWHDLVGLEAVNREGAPLGRVTGFMEMPAHPLIVLEGERQRLVPLVPERLLAVDLAAGRVTLEWHPDD